MLTTLTESSLHPLLHERNVLHRPLPPLFQLPAPLTHPVLRPQQPILHPARFACRS